MSINVSSMLHFCTKFYLVRKLQSTFHLHTCLHQQRWYPSSCTLQQAQWISTRFGFILRNSQIRHATKCRWRFTSRSTIASAPDFWYCWKVIGIPTSACRKLLMTLQMNGHNWSAHTYFCSDTPLWDSVGFAWYVSAVLLEMSHQSKYWRDSLLWFKVNRPWRLIMNASVANVLVHSSFYMGTWQGSIHTIGNLQWGYVYNRDSPPHKSFFQGVDTFPHCTATHRKVLQLSTKLSAL